jgi:uncharacterized membrane protein
VRPPHGIDIERIRAFADAVFAIAITLLALEMTVPEGRPPDELGQDLREALPSVVAYLLSFVVVGLLWISHHRLLNTVESLDDPILYLDLAFLAVVAALPFPTKIIGDYHNNAIAISVYAGMIAVCALLIAVTAAYLLRRPALCVRGIPRSRIMHSAQQAASVALVFATSIPITLFSPTAAEYWWVLGVPVRFWLSRRHAEAPVTVPTPGGSL